MTEETKPAQIPAPESRPDYEMNVTHDDSSKVMMIATIVILVVAIIGGVIAVTPKVRENAEQKQQIAALNEQVQKLRQEEKKPGIVEEQLNAVQAKMQELSDQARNFQSGADVQGKLADLESKFNTMAQQSHALGLSGMLARVQAMQQTPEGANMLSGLVSMLANSPADKDVGESLENLRMADPNVAQVTEGVAPEDMKAAAMLIAMAQLRHSLMRNNDSFDEDLALLKKTISADDVNLLAAIDRLAPQAKYGVLTPQGLSQQFRGLTGEVVSASLTGQDVSIGEKAKARLADVFLVEKNGQRVSGTETQIAVAAAQKELDAGNIQGAVDILNTLNGPAAEKTRPFVEQAQATLLAGNLQGMLTQNLVQNIKSGVAGMVNGMPNGVVNPNSLNGITNKIKSYVPGAQPAPIPLKQP